jgi:hypothetical protein
VTETARDATRDLRRRVAARFGKRSGAVPMPEHAVLFEVPVDGVRRIRWHGGQYEKHVRRRIDAVAVGLWASTKHVVHGFELKASRSDLVKELRDPDKSEPARRLCDRWWLVLADLKLLGDDQVPDGWGVLYRRGRGLYVHQQPAPLNTTADPRFVAALIQTAITGRGSIAHGLGAVDGYQRGYRQGVKHGELSGRQASYWDGFHAGQAHRDHLATVIGNGKAS